MRLRRVLFPAAFSLCSIAWAQTVPLPTTSGNGFTGAPYSGKETTTTTTGVPGGGKTTRSEVKLVWRDTKGRTRHEYLWQNPSGIEYRSVVVTDPIAGVILKWTVDDSPQTSVVTVGPLAERERITAPPSSRYSSENSVQPGSVKSCGPLCRLETLAPQQISGEFATGTRTTRIVQNMTTINELWVSPELGIILRHITDDPLGGRNETNVTDVVRGDSDPSLFRVPKGYEVRLTK